jgi:membrane complex biogenesis BtpA family protein
MFTDQGRIDGVAGETLRIRAALGAEIPIFADVLVKHATPPAGTRVADAVRDTWHRGLADALVVSGAGTGLPTSADHLAEARDAVPEARIWIGSGLTPDRVADLLPGADGAIVGSALQREGRAGADVEPERVARFMEQVERLRGRPHAG